MEFFISRQKRKSRALVIMYVLEVVIFWNIHIKKVGYRYNIMKKNKKTIEYCDLDPRKDKNLMIEVCLKLADLKYTVHNKYVITEIKDKEGTKIRVKICDDLNDIHFSATKSVGESICDELAQYVDRPYVFKLTDGLEDYKKAQSIKFERLVNTEGTYFVKVFNIKKSANLERADQGRSWINYFGQLCIQFLCRKKYVWDANKGSGIWASGSRKAEDLLKGKKTKKRYGDYAFILKPVKKCFYAVGDGEILGDKFEVVGVFKRQELLMKLKGYSSKGNGYGKLDPLTELCKNEELDSESRRTMREILFQRLKYRFAKS